GGIDPVDAELDGATDGGDRVGIVLGPPTGRPRPADGPGAEPDAGDLRSLRAELRRPHLARSAAGTSRCSISAKRGVVSQSPVPRSAVAAIRLPRRAHSRGGSPCRRPYAKPAAKPSPAPISSTTSSSRSGATTA